MTPGKESGLRVGELARLAGTTTRTIRHYHRLGLLPERRDESGYRRYGPEQLVRLVRIRRLRALDMPLEQIAASLATEPAEGEGSAALRALAGDLGREIERLQNVRARVLALAASESPSDPAAAWGAELRRRGLLAEPGDLPQPEQAAARLLDALHPDGIRGVIEQAAEVMSDPVVTERLGALLRRFESLPDDAADDDVEALAAEYAAVLPSPSQRPPSVDAETMERLLGAASRRPSCAASAGSGSCSSAATNDVLVPQICAYQRPAQHGPRLG